MKHNSNNDPCFSFRIQTKQKFQEKTLRLSDNSWFCGMETSKLDSSCRLADIEEADGDVTLVWRSTWKIENLEVSSSFICKPREREKRCQRLNLHTTTESEKKRSMESDKLPAMIRLNSFCWGTAWLALAAIIKKRGRNKEGRVLVHALFIRFITNSQIMV